MSTQGHRRITATDIAHAVGVSQATVSNAINRPDLVAPGTRDRIREAMTTLGYVVNGSARALRSGTSAAVGAIVLDIANPFWGEVIKGIEQVTAAASAPLLIGSSSEDPQLEQLVLDSFASQSVSGILAAPTEPGLEELRRLARTGVRVVLLDRHDPLGGLPSASIDHAFGTAAATAHLAARGHRRIAFVNGSHRLSWSAGRSRGVHEEAARHPGMEIVEFEMKGMRSIEGARAVPEILALTAPVTAIQCANDMLALGVLQGLQAAGVSVPRDVSVVGYDDSVFASMLSPALTTVSQDGQELGRAAAELLLTGALSGGALQPPHLIERDSVRSVVAADLLSSESSRR